MLAVSLGLLFRLGFVEVLATWLSDTPSLNMTVDFFSANQRFFSVTSWGIGLDYHDIECFALEMNRDHFVIFEIASKYCISDPFIDHDGYSISSKGFLPMVVDIMVI